MCKEILLSRGAVALVDAHDYERVMAAGKWSLDGNGYACRMESYYVDGQRKRRKIMLHRFILDAQPGIEVDHRFHNKLDCRRKRIRLATPYQNRCNSRPNKNGTSRYKGVRFHQRDCVWAAEIRVRGKKQYLGNFTDEADAANAYDQAAYAAWGEFAYINLPDRLHAVHAPSIAQRKEPVTLI